MTRIDQTIDAAGKWLLAHQDPTSGGWPDRPGGHVNVLNTSEAVISLIDSDLCKAGEKPIKDAVAYLARHQARQGPDQGCWPREVSRDDGSIVHLPDLVRTSFAVQALYRAGVGGHESPSKEALAWLFQVRDQSGGWGFHRDGEVAFMPTCFALSALLEGYADCSESCQQLARASLAWLVDNHYNDGGVALRGAFGPPGPMRGVHTIYGGLVLQLARRQGIHDYREQEKEAIEWLLRHPDDAIKLREEWMQIDPAASTGSGGGNYGFMFMTDTLLIRLLIGSDNKADRDSKLARAAMHNLKDKVDGNTGAFFGPRIFSWSTAKAVSALCVMQKQTGPEFPDLPSREPEYKGRKAGPVIVGFSIALALIGFFLIRDSQFGLLEFGYFFGLLLAALLAYGLVGERTFREIVIKLLGQVKPTSTSSDT